MTQSSKTKLAAASLAFLMLVLVFVNSIPPAPDTNPAEISAGPTSSQESFEGIVSEAPEATEPAGYYDLEKPKVDETGATIVNGMRFKEGVWLGYEKNQQSEP